MQALKTCIEQLVAPSAPIPLKICCADALLFVCLRKHQQCNLALLEGDLRDLVAHILTIARCSKHLSTQLAVLMLLGAAADEESMVRFFICPLNLI